jgi:hypothetical protein
MFLTQHLCLCKFADKGMLILFDLLCVFGLAVQSLLSKSFWLTKHTIQVGEVLPVQTLCGFGWWYCISLVYFHKVIRYSSYQSSFLSLSLSLLVLLLVEECPWDSN